MPRLTDTPQLTPASLQKLEAERAERRRQVRGLLLLALAALVFTIFRVGVHRVFTVGWWRLW